MSAHQVRVSAWGLGLASAILLASVGTAQPPVYPPKLPDPTQPSEKLKKVLMPPPIEGPAAPRAAAEKKSELRLRGRVISKERALAVIELNGVAYVLPVGGEMNGLKVLEISITGVKVEVGPSKDVLVLH